MLTQKEWEEFSSFSKYLPQNFNRSNILQVVCKIGLEGGLPYFEKWPKGVVDYPFKMRFRKCNRNKGAIFIFNDFCINNEPLSQLSVAFREYNAAVFGKQYVIEAAEYIINELSSVCKKQDAKTNTSKKTNLVMLFRMDKHIQNLYKIANLKTDFLQTDKSLQN